MMELIQGDLKETEPKGIIYFMAYSRLLKKMVSDIRASNQDELDDDKYKKLIFLYVKVIVHQGMESHTAELDFQVAEGMKAAMARLTPLEFINMFPVRKTYDGERYQGKDYFYTMKKLKEYDIHEPIGGERMNRFLWDYWNININKFVVYQMACIDKIRRSKGQKGTMEEFLEQKGVPTYNMHEKEGLVINNKTGEISKVVRKKRRVPKHMQVLSGENN